MIIECEIPLPTIARLLDGLFVVWIDLNFGGEFGPADWQPNSDPQSLAAALDEAAELRKPQAEGYPWVCKVEPA